MLSWRPAERQSTNSYSAQHRDKNCKAETGRTMRSKNRKCEMTQKNKQRDRRE